MTKELTPRQEEALSFICSHWKQKGYSPTTREVAEHLDVAQTAAIGFLRLLEKKGVIRRTDGVGRSIVVL